MALEATEEGVGPSIVFSLEDDAPGSVSVLDEERGKHKTRAERFGTVYKEPARHRTDLIMEAKRERLRREGFKTGFDFFSEEEAAKRSTRAERFNIEQPALQYKPDEELEARARRAQKFGIAYQPTDAVLMDMDLYEARAEAAPDVERRPEAIYLYGVDVMSTKDVLMHFSDYGPSFVEWLNDSACNVVFDDEHSCKRAIAGSGAPVPPEVGPDGQTSISGLPSQDYADFANLPYVWHKCKDFVKDGTTISLIYRMATIQDTRDFKQPKRTRELWKPAGAGTTGGGAGGRARNMKGGARFHPYGRQADGEDEAEPMDVDMEEAAAAEGGDGDVQMKRTRGQRGGKQHAAKQARRDAALHGQWAAAGATLASDPALALDYTDLEEAEAPAAVSVAAAAAHSRPAGSPSVVPSLPEGVTDLRQLLKLKRAQQGTIQKGYQEAGYSGGSGEWQALGSGKGQAGSDGNGAVMEA